MLSGLSVATQAAYFFTVETAVTSPDGASSPLGLAAALGSTFPRDDAASFNYGGSFTDSANDVCTADQTCTSSTHPQIDLVGGAAHPVDFVFRDDFE